MKRTLTILQLIFATMGMYAYVGETFTYEGVQYKITYEDATSGVYQVGINHYDTACVIVPDFIMYNGEAYQVAQTAPFLSAYCALQHYTKVDFSQLQYDFSVLLNPYTSGLNFQFYYVDSAIVDTLVLPPYSGTVMVGRMEVPFTCDTLMPGIRHLVVGDKTPARIGIIGGDFCLALKSLDMSAYPYTDFAQIIDGHGSSTGNVRNLSDFPFLERVILPNTIRSFPCGLTVGSRSISNITMPDSLESIEINAFGDIAMDTLRLGSKVRTIEDGWAAEWRSLKYIDVDPSNPYFSSDKDGCLLSKGGNVFHHYPSGKPEESYQLPYSIDTIGHSAFALYSSYRWSENFSYFGGTTSLPVGYAGGMYSLCSQLDGCQDAVALREVKLHSGVRTIQFQAFYGSSIRQINSAEGKTVDFSFSNVRDIQRMAFAGSLLDSISLPSSLVNLGSENVGWHRYQIGTSCYFQLSGGDGTCTGQVFQSCRNLQNIRFDKAENLEFIGQLCFAFCDKLQRVDLLPCKKLNTIHNAICYGDSALTYVALPHAVDYIGYGAFAGCVSLEKIVCPAPIPIPIDSSVFRGVNKQTCELSVPAASIPLYRNTPVWREFFNITSNGMTAVAVTSGDTTMGTVRGGGGYNSGDNITITATPKEGFEFVGWSDGNTDNPRTVTVTQDVSLTAIFQYTNYHIDARPNDSTLGYVTGGGLYHLHDSITLWAHPNEHGKFIEWSDGYKYSLRDWEVTGDTTLIAYFELFGDTTHTDTTVVRYTLTAVPNDSTMGFVVGGGEYAAGEDAYLTAVPYDGYCFREWDFTSRKEPSVTFVMTPFDATVTAYFEAIDDALPMTPADPADTDPDHTRYNILGQPVDETYHGIVIQNGQKRVQ